MSIKWTSALIASVLVLSLFAVALTIAGETNPPSVTNLSASPSIIAGDGTEYTELTVNVTDDTAVDNVTVDLTPIGGKVVYMTCKGNYTENGKVISVFNYTTNATCPPGTHSLTISAIDIFGNSDTGSVSLYTTGIIRDLPDSVKWGDDFYVTVNWIAPSDNFNSIGLNEWANKSANMTVTVNKTWCTPVANAATTKENDTKAEIAWYGPYSEGTEFTAIYKVHVPVGVKEGDYTFVGNLSYFIASTPYEEEVTGDSVITIEKPETSPVRDMPATVMKGSNFTVEVSWTAPIDDFNTIELHEEANATANMTVTGDTSWCSPSADNLTEIDSTIEYEWSGSYSNGTAFTAVYKVHVPEDTPSGSYTFNGNLEYYFGSEGPYTEIVSGDSVIEVIEGIPISGRTGEVNCSIEPNVVITLYNKTTGNAVAETTSDENGNYTIAAPCLGKYEVNASKGGFKNETQEITIAETEPYTLDFRGEYGLTPEDPSMSYALECVNHWLYAEEQPEECRLSMSKALEVVNAWLY